MATAPQVHDGLSANSCVHALTALRWLELPGAAGTAQLKRACLPLGLSCGVAGAAQVQGTVFADRGVRSLTALRSLRCLALEVYQNVAMDGLVCLSVITQVTQLQARAHTSLYEGLDGTSGEALSACLSPRRPCSCSRDRGSAVKGVARL